MRPGRSFERVWYAHAFVRELVLIYPTAAIMMQARGVSPVALAALFMIWSASSVAFELPTGVLADRLSRKHLLVISGAVKGCAFIIWWLAPEFWGFAVGFVVWGLGSALRSGTGEAFLHDVLAAKGRALEFERIYGRGQAAGTCGVGLALVTGGWAAEHGFTLPLLASALAPWSAAVLAAVAFDEPPRSAAAAEREGFLGTLAAGMRELHGGRTLALIVAMLVLLPTVYDVLEEYVPPLLDELGFTLTEVGWVYGAAFAARAVGMMLAHRLRAAGSERLCLVFAAGGLVLGAGVLAGDRVPGGGQLPAIALSGYFALTGVGSVLLQGRLQAAITGHARATVTSVAGALQEVFSLALYLAIGTAAEWLDWQLAVVATGAWLLASSLLFRLALRRGGSGTASPAGTA